MARYAKIDTHLILDLILQISLFMLGFVNVSILDDIYFFGKIFKGSLNE